LWEKKLKIEFIGKTTKEQNGRPHMHADAQLEKKATAVDRPKA